MIRNIALIKLKADSSDEHVQALIDAVSRLKIPGMRSLSVARDAGLREGNAQLAIFGDFDDEAAYQAYDADPEHNRIRRELLAPLVERVERCQIRL